MTKAEKLELFYTKVSPFKEGIDRLRAFLNTTALTEDWKWSFPTYTLKGKNVVAVASFKQHYGLWFFQGALLSDPYKMLENAQEGKTKAMRHLKFTTLNSLDITIVKQYVAEAIANCEQGKEVKIKRAAVKVNLPIQLKNALMNDEQLQINFDALSPGKRKAYGAYINDAKQEATKQRRLEKCIPLILERKGLNDSYK